MRAAKGRAQVLDALALVLVLACSGCAVESSPVACPEPTQVEPEFTEAIPPAHPNLDEASFLPLLGDQELRTQLWRVYVGVEPLAMRFAGSPERWTPVRLVIASDRAQWSDHGLIEIPVAADDLGVLAHELFHGSFHRSPFNAGRDSAWGEGFADAFRYLIERDVLGDEPSPWRIEMDRLAALDTDELQALRSQNDVVRQYSYPALLILERAEGDFERFEALWNELGERRRAAGGDILHEEFGDVLR